MFKASRWNYQRRNESILWYLFIFGLWKGHFFCLSFKILSENFYLFICLLCLFGHIFFLSFYINIKKKRKIFSQTYTLLTQYLYTGQILSSNSFNCSQKYPLKFFLLQLFLKSPNIILNFFYTIVSFWLGNFFQKYITRVAIFFFF